MVSVDAKSVDLWAHESRGLAMSISGIVIATLSVILRFFARMKKGSTLGADDWMILPSLLCYWGFSITAIWGTTQGGLGIDFALLPAPQAIATGKTSYIMPIFTVPTISFAKLSIVCLYHRVFATPKFRVWNMIVGGSVVAWMVACLFATIMQCIPPHALWNHSIKGRCINFTLFFQFIEPINCFQDLVIALMPISVIRGLQLGPKQKVSLCLIFVLGGMVAVISLIRIVIISNPAASPMEIYTSSEWLTAQLWMAILCANLLTYRSLLHTAIPARLRTWLTGSAPVSNNYEMWSKGRDKYKRRCVSEDELVETFHS